MSTPLFILRAIQLGLSMVDLDLLSIGLVNDLFIENSNDEYPYQQIATQEDFDKF